MKIGVPKGLLFYKYHIFMETFFKELGAEIIVSPDTNRHILNEGVKYCVDEACLPVKIFHGHVCWLRDKCDAILIPRIMSIHEKEYICPKFCGLTEMISNSIPDLPYLIGDQIYFTKFEKLTQWALKAGSLLTNNKRAINTALIKAIEKQSSTKMDLCQSTQRFKVALLGHPYNIYDSFINMNLIQKLNRLGVEVVTEESVDQCDIEEEVSKLYKKPFWTFAKNLYGAAVSIAKGESVNGIIYVSSFACGIDSVILELIEKKIENLPFLVLKIDEHTGEAGFDTRIEAFVDMLGRRMQFDDHNTAYGQRISCGKSAV